MIGQSDMFSSDGTVKIACKEHRGLSGIKRRRRAIRAVALNVL